MDISHDFYKSFREYTSKSQSLDEFVLGFRLKSIGMLKKAHITLLLVNLGLHAAACGEVSDPADPSYAPDQYIAPMDASGALLDQGVPRPITTVSVATFNVRKFFDTNCDTRNCGPGSLKPCPQTRIRAKAQQIANGIRILEADILLLQEIETQTCLDTLLEALSDQGYTTAVLGETGGSASLDVAVVSKVPVVGRRSYQDVQIPLPNGGSTTFSRDLLEVHLDYGDSRVIVFNAHFKAKTRDDPDRRLAEATAARDIVTAVAEEEPNALVVLGGDLNTRQAQHPSRLSKGRVKCCVLLPSSARMMRPTPFKAYLKPSTTSTLSRQSAVALSMAQLVWSDPILAASPAVTTPVLWAYSRP